jgi:hypothetical protein
MAFTPTSRARLPLVPPSQAGGLSTRQASLHVTDRSVAPPKGLSTLGSDPTRFQTKPPACYRASWQLPGPDSHRQATTSFRPRHSHYLMTTSWSLDAPCGDLDGLPPATTPAITPGRSAPRGFVGAARRLAILVSSMPPAVANRPRSTRTHGSSAIPTPGPQSWSVRCHPR